MSEIQNLVYAIEVGGLRTWILRGALVVLVLGLGIYYAVTQFNGFNNPEAMDTAQIGRQIVTGQGFTTKLIRPSALKNMIMRNGARSIKLDHFPETVQPPVYPYLLAGLFKATGVNFEVKTEKLREFRLYKPEVTVVIFDTVCLILAVLVFYVWMLRAFDNRVALVGSILWISSDLTWNFVISGMPVAFLLLLVCLMGLLMSEAVTADDEEQPVRSLVLLALSGVILGIAILTRYSLLALLLPFVAFGFLGFSKKFLSGLVAGLIPLLICLPWLMRNYSVTGNLFGHAWMACFAHDSTIWRMFSQSVQDSIGLRSFMRAFTMGISNSLNNFGGLFGGLLPPVLFLCSILHAFRRPSVQRPRLFWVAALAFLVCFNAPVLNRYALDERFELNTVFVLSPVLAGYGAAFLFILIERLRMPSPILQIPILVAVCGLQVIPLGLHVFQRQSPLFSYPPYFPPVMILMKNWVKAEETQASDIPWAGAWYTDRVTIWLPEKKKDFNEMNDFHFRIAAMLLTTESANRHMFSEIDNGEYADWAGLIKRSDFHDLPLPRFTPLPPNKGDYLFFSDTIRWTQ